MRTYAHVARLGTRVRAICAALCGWLAPGLHTRPACQCHVFVRTHVCTYVRTQHCTYAAVRPEQHDKEQMRRRQVPPPQDGWGDGWGDGWNDGWGVGWGDGWGDGWVDGWDDGWGVGWGDGWRWGGTDAIHWGEREDDEAGIHLCDDGPQETLAPEAPGPSPCDDACTDDSDDHQSEVCTYECFIQMHEAVRRRIRTGEPEPESSEPGDTFSARGSGDEAPDPGVAFPHADRDIAAGIVDFDRATGGVTCRLCNELKCNSKSQYNDHWKGHKHQKKMLAEEKRKERNVCDVPASRFQ